MKSTPNKVIDKLKAIPYMRVVQLGQSTRFPAININIDRTGLRNWALMLPLFPGH